MYIRRLQKCVGMIFFSNRNIYIYKVPKLHLFIYLNECETWTSAASRSALGWLFPLYIIYIYLHIYIYNVYIKVPKLHLFKCLSHCDRVQKKNVTEQSYILDFPNRLYIYIYIHIYIYVHVIFARLYIYIYCFFIYIYIYSIYQRVSSDCECPIGKLCKYIYI